jgi:hypothetical protein
MRKDDEGTFYDVKDDSWAEDDRARFKRLVEELKERLRAEGHFVFMERP